MKRAVYEAAEIAGYGIAGAVGATALWVAVTAVTP